MNKAEKDQTDDLSAHNHVNESLLEQYKLFASISDGSTDAIYVKDIHGRYLLFNKEAARTVGKKPEDVIGKDDFSIFPAHEAEAIVDGDRKIMESRMSSTYEEVVTTVDGIVTYLSTKGPTFDTEGKVSGLFGIARDITERKRMENSLLANEKSHKVILQTALDGYWLVDMQHRILEVNDAYCQMSGFSKLELLSMSIPDLEVLETLEDVNGRIQKIIAKGELRFESKHRCKDRNVIDVEVSVRYLPAEKLMVVFTRDITKRKLAEEALKKSEERYRGLLTNMDVGIVAHRADTSIAMCNSAASQLLGLSENQMKGKVAIDPEWKFLDINNNPLALDEYPVNRILSSRKPMRNQILAVMRPVTNDVVWLSVNGFPVLDNTGAIAEILINFIDVTELKHAEGALKERDKQFRKLTELAPVGIYLTTSDGNCMYANPAWCKMAGLSLEEALGTGWINGLHPDDRNLVFCNWKKMVESQGQWGHEYRFMTSEGKITWVYGLATSQYDTSGKITLYVGVNQNITERKQLEEEREKSEQQRNQMQKLESLGILAGGIAHDFNNLMGGIFGYIDMACEETKDDKVKSYISKAMSSIDRARALTQQLLTFAKGGAPIQEIGHLFPLVQETAKFALSGSNVSCNFDVSHDLWACNFDKNQIGQVIDNLIINAQQAMPVGGVIELTARNISLTVKDHPFLSTGNYVRIALKDTGIGIPNELISKIFDPFFTTKTKGHGLGLATCYSIIHRHGGCIDVESEPGKGSTFKVYLPASSQSVLSDLKKSTQRHKGSGTILVMDDEEIMRETIQDMLGTFGYFVVCKENGNDAIDFFKEEMKEKRTPAAMIFDLTVPGGMGGEVAIEEIRKLNRNIPVFVASGYADDPIMVNPTEYGFTASICKPFRIGDLSDMLNKYLEPKR